MLSESENRLLTEVGPGTRMGALLRRYWFPIALADEMRPTTTLGTGCWTKRVRILGEDLVLFRTRRGELGLIAEACPHRRASLAYGIPEADGIRCPYHGWKFDATGACLDQPNEPPQSAFKDKIRTQAYPVEALGGLLWAYLGPAPAPLVPRWDGLVAEGAIRTIGVAETIDCNWLQIMENSVDPVHTQWLHGALYEFTRERAGEPQKVGLSVPIVRIAFDEFAYGIVKRKLAVGQTEEDDDWKIGHPLVFPNVLALGNAADDWHEYRFEFRTPIDDTHTFHVWYGAFVPPPGSHVDPKLLERIFTYDVPIRAGGDYLAEMVHGQDALAWETPGPIADRTREHLGSTDRGVTLYRRMLLRELERMESGGDPKNVFRDPTSNQFLALPVEGKRMARLEGFESIFRRMEVSFSPIAEELIAIFTGRTPTTLLPAPPSDSAGSSRRASRPQRR